ncbi:hypothetical protein SK854_16990 [Lentzea sp. BCCO 10_0061]|uniref:Uncharacterized protein n=1 Tax=Lentzea sokolovensis TaxID=3095429 RepID=A0ABU4UYU0_9PSEU|nr:hypothetical protein [Lentzea sp. BCCO 10_0061]MDX8143825.1 hypothetical protein [Lentzea sp. BCCO 10_0061]
MDERLICAKHLGSGPLAGPVVFADDLVVVSHRPGEVLGYLFVETRRHVAALDLLTVTEAEAVARAVRLAAVGLRAELDPEFVFSAVAGRVRGALSPARVRPASRDAGRTGVDRGGVGRGASG